MKKRLKTRAGGTRAKVSDDDHAIYAILREEFSAADLQKYTEVDTLVPAEQVLRELEAASRKKLKLKKRA